jgi:membrane-associated phospholipid phosphatase
MRFARRIGTDRPVLSFLAAALVAYLVLVGAMTMLGLFLTKVLLSLGGFSAWDEGISEWLANHRTPSLENASWIGSTLAGGLVIPCVIAFFVVTFLALHRWRLAAFVLFAVVLESGAYRLTSLIVPRERPSVPRLEHLPVDASYPSGHTAASLALYGGLLLLLISRLQSKAIAVVAWLGIVAVPLFVAWARLYRGMHHFTDAVAGVILGVAALVAIVFASRVAGATDGRTHPRSGGAA